MMSELGIDHPTVTPENYDEESKALIMTHPFERFGADEEEIKECLDGQTEFDDVYYVGQSDGRIPVMVDIVGKLEDENKQSELPPGFEDGSYERGLEEDEWGSLEVEESMYLLDNYDEIAVGGAERDFCVDATLDSLRDIRKTDQAYSTTELKLEEDLAYSNRD